MTRVELNGREDATIDTSVAFSKDVYEVFGTEFKLSELENNKDCAWDGGECESNFATVKTKFGDVDFSWYVHETDAEVILNIDTASTGNIQMNVILDGGTEQNTMDLEDLIKRFEETFYEKRRSIPDEKKDFVLNMKLTCTYSQMLAIREMLDDTLVDMCESHDFDVYLKYGRYDCDISKFEYKENKDIVDQLER